MASAQAAEFRNRHARFFSARAENSSTEGLPTCCCCLHMRLFETAASCWPMAQTGSSETQQLKIPSNWTQRLARQLRPGRLMKLLAMEQQQSGPILALPRVEEPVGVELSEQREAIDGPWRRSASRRALLEQPQSYHQTTNSTRGRGTGAVIDLPVTSDETLSLRPLEPLNYRPRGPRLQASVNCLSVLFSRLGCAAWNLQ
ncbi:hypothetical protein TgHK011_002230 [Trichoderma gracile]|nr:hypothetical protein TgHK011_002230 [Trichoderma gracile]